MADAASPDLAAADLLAGFALGAPLQNPKASPVGQLAPGGGNAARGKGAQVGGAQPRSECGNADVGGPAGCAPPFADAAAAVQQAMVMVQREQVNFAFRDGLGKRGRKNKEAELERLAERKRANTEAMPLIVPMIQPPREQMLPGAPMEDPQIRQEIRHLPFIPQPSMQLLPQVAMPRLPPAPKSPNPTLPPTFHELLEKTTHTLCASRSQMQHVPPFQAAAYKHPTSVGGQWESTIAGPLPPAHIDRATALEEAQRLAASTAGVLQIPPLFNQTAEAAFPAMCDTMPLSAANPPGAPALAAFPNGGGVLERGLRRHLKAQGPARPRARRVAPSSPSKIVGDGPIGNLCSAAFAADSSSYAIGCARASQATHANLLAE